MAFIGEYDCKLDSKGRFLLPAALKRQVEPAARETFVLNRGFEGCLMLYPMDVWESLTNQLKKLNLFIAKNRRFYRQFQNGATSLTLDGNSRLLIPKNLMEYAGINKEVILFAYADRIEVWDKKRYEEYMKDTSDFEALAEEVMGDQNEEGSPDVS